MATRLPDTEGPQSNPSARPDLAGAVGVPIGVVAVLLSLIVVVGMQIFWVPASLAITLGAIGLWRQRRGRGSRTLSWLAIGLGLGSAAITGVWLLLFLALRFFSER